MENDIPKRAICKDRLQDYFLKLLEKEDATPEELALIPKIAELLF